MDSHAARERRRTSSQTQSAKGGVARRLLRLTKRSYQRPGGAGTSTSRMDKSTSPHRWLGRVARSESPGRSESCLISRRMKKFTAIVILLIMTALHGSPQTRPRARELGITVGILPTGTLNAITDVDGVLVGHTTIVRGDNIRTGVTAILPHGGNLFREKVPGAVFVGNGFGKLAGSTQVNELGEIETPILLTSTLSVPRVADFLIDYMLALPGNEDVQSINPRVAETNDGYLNDIRGRHISRDDVFAAIKGAKGGAVAEGSVGAGTGTVAFGFKGGIGTASRKLPARLGGFSVGADARSEEHTPELQSRG